MQTCKQIETENTVWPTGCQAREEFVVCQMATGAKRGTLTLKNLGKNEKKLKYNGE